jgi:thioredoxin 1
MAHQLTSTDFEEKVTNSKGIVLVDFWADWCPPCKALAPIIAGVAEEAAGKATVYKLDTDANQDIAAAHGIVSIPTVKIFKDGKEVESIIGLHQKHEYMRAIEQHA